MQASLNRRSVLLGGAATIGLTALPTAPSPAARPSPQPPFTGLTATTTASLDAALSRYLATRSGTVGLTVYDRNSRIWHNYRPRTNQTLSTIKLVVLATVLRVSQERGVPLTRTQRSWAARMIQQSDNAATDNLIAQVGVANLRRVARMFGMTHTDIQGGSGGNGWWGYSTTTPQDMIRIADGIAYSNAVLTTANTAYVRALWHGVIASQRWGVLGSLPGGLTGWGNKNGWGPMSGGYRLNSVGWVRGHGRNYTLAILTRSPAGFYYGRDTINRVGRIVYDQLGTPLR